MSDHPERSPLLVNSVVKEVPELNDHDAVSIQAINSSLQSLLRNKLGEHAKGKVPPWYKYATVAVFYYAVAASFGALVSGCTLSFPSSAVLDLTDSGLKKEYIFDERLSDIFGVSKASQGFTTFCWKQSFIIVWVPAPAPFTREEAWCTSHHRLVLQACGYLGAGENQATCMDP